MDSLQILEAFKVATVAYIHVPLRAGHRLAEAPRL